MLTRDAGQRIERRWWAMGSLAHVVIDGGDEALIDAAVARIIELESRWSRFMPTSEISQLNAACGATVTVSQDTLMLVDRAVHGSFLTGGAYDPTMLGQLIELGYDQPFRAGHETRRVAPPAQASAGCDGININRDRSQITLATGTLFDPGGIGKGLAADIVSGELIDHGASRVLVNIGGDLRIRSLQHDDPWTVLVDEDAAPGLAPTTVVIADGGVATSTTLKRRWSAPEAERHHALSATTGLPSTGGPSVVTAIAGAAWWAEVVATARLTSHAERCCSDVQNVATRVAYPGGLVTRSGGFERYER